MGYSFISKIKWGERKNHFFPHSWVDFRLPSSAPPPGWIVPTWSSQDYNVVWTNYFRSQYNNGIYFEMPPFHKLIVFYVCREHVPRIIVGCESSVIILLFGGMSHASAAWF